MHRKTKRLFVFIFAWLLLAQNLAFTAHYYSHHVLKVATEKLDHSYRTYVAHENDDEDNCVRCQAFRNISQLLVSQNNFYFEIPASAVRLNFYSQLNCGDAKISPRVRGPPLLS